MAELTAQSSDDVKAAREAGAAQGPGVEGGSPMQLTPPTVAPAIWRNRRELPTYTQSLLRIMVPVSVTLAEKRQPLGRIIELSPGTIIQFDKSCGEMLELSVGNRPIAAGEAVKVGDKFGLRVTTMTPPTERFRPVQPPKNHKA